MSNKQKAKIKCAHCGHESEQDFWVSINADMNPEIKEKLINGELFRHVCEKCGKESVLDYPVLYHDMTNRAMVYYIIEDTVEEVEGYFNEVEKDLGVTMEGYRKRIVTDLNALREKAIIFDNGLDDRLIELIKFFSFVEAAQKHQDKNVVHVYFAVIDGELLLEFIADEPFYYKVSKEFYEHYEKVFGPYLPEDVNENMVVDVAWALDFLEKVKPEGMGETAEADAEA